MTVEQQVGDLKKRIADAVKARASAEHQLAVARDHKEQAEKELRQEFGVGPAEVPDLVRKLEADLQAEIGRAEQQLARAEEQA